MDVVTGRIGIDDVAPVIAGGRYPAKAVVGEVVPVAATVWREGHDAVAATLVVRCLGPSYPQLAEGPLRRISAPRDRDKNAARVKPVHIPMQPGGALDRFHANFVPDREGLWTFRVDGWGDPVATWRHNVAAKLEAGQGAAELANDLEIGARLFERAAAGVPRKRRQPLLDSADALRTDDDPGARFQHALSVEALGLLDEFPLRDLLTRGTQYGIWVDRTRALYGAWYELFPRSTGGVGPDGRPMHGTLATAAADLARVAAMGFDVVYLPPIHPIGEVNRKGRNNNPIAEPGEVGSPWAIGSVAGGHDAVHPELGTLKDFDRFVATAQKLGLEVALDLALQCAPDHPWVRAHPEWFTQLPDGTIAYAENPPKKYQDIYPLNFDTDPAGLYTEVLRVVQHWISHGVKIFRVDNPHTKPPDFWQWLIGEVKAADPDVLFLSEAFTRPARLYGLARLGFTQSYTYFTWRTGKSEIADFGREIAAQADQARPNLFVNTPDILHASLQHGGPGMFAIRAVLAGTLSPTWGMYSGYELYEHVPLRDGSEEYLDSEKYQLRPRDYKGAAARGESLEPFITRLNEIRRLHPALHQLRNITFHHVENDALLAYSKFDPVTGDAVLVVVNLNPFGPEDGTLWVDLPALGLDWHETFWVRDELTGEQYRWGQANYVRLDPLKAVAHILNLPQVREPARAQLVYRP